MKRVGPTVKAVSIVLRPVRYRYKGLLCLCLMKECSNIVTLSLCFYSQFYLNKIV